MLSEQKYLKAPVLRTRRLLVREFCEQDLTGDYVAWLNDSEVVRYSEQRHRTHTMVTCRNYFLGFGSGDDLLLAVEHDVFGHIGNMTIYVDALNVTNRAQNEEFLSSGTLMAKQRDLATSKSRLKLFSIDIMKRSPVSATLRLWLPRRTRAHPVFQKV